MKNFKILMLSLFVGSSVLYNSCTKEEAYAVPSGLTVTPAEAGAGTLITIKGKGMKNLTQVLFGDVPAGFNPVYNTDSVLLVRVPEGAKDGLNKVSLINKGGETTIGTFDFKVLAAKPIIIDYYPKSSYPGSDITVTGQNFDKPNLVVTVGGKEGKVVLQTAEKIVFEMPAGTNGGKILIAHGGGKVESTADVTLDAILMDFDDNGPADKSWKYWSGDNDQSGNFDPKQSNPAPKAGGYGKLAVTKGKTSGGYAMIGHDPAAAKWDLTNITADSKLRFMVNNNGTKETRVAFDFTVNGKSYQQAIVFDDTPGWRLVELPLNKFANSAGQPIPDYKKIGELRFFLQGYSAAKPMEANFDNVCLSAN